MSINTKSLFFWPHFGPFALAVSVTLLHAGTAVAEEISAIAQLPDSFVGMTNGTLQPKNTFQPYIGSAQTSPASSGGQTGRQVYYGGLRYRGSGPWQIGASVAIFDDVPAMPINGSNKSVTYVGTGLDLKYQLYETSRLSAALLIGVEAAYYSRGGGLSSQSSVSPGDKDRFLASTLSFPITYQLNDRFWVTGEVGYTHAATTVAGETGFGGRAFASAGAAYRVSDRFFAYGAIKGLARQISGGIDAPKPGNMNYLYTLGGQFALTPQSALNFYVTNAFSPTPTGDDFLFFPHKDKPVFGARLTYTPSGKGVGEGAVTFRPAMRVNEKSTRFADGFTINAPHTLASDRIHTRLSYGSADHSALSVYYTTDPDFQIEFSVENYALGSGTNFRLAAEEDLRFFIGGRWQAMDEAYGHPFNLGFGMSAGRDFKEPSVGSLFAYATASKSFGWGEAALNARSAVYASETLAGVGVSLTRNFGESFSVIGEYTAAMNDQPVWAFGLRHSAKSLPFSIDLYSTNAAGINGLGSLLSNDKPRVGISISWEGGLDLL